MGQAASYAESSVQRALLRLKEEEQADEDELLCACGYSRASLSSCTNGSAATAAQSRCGAESAGSSLPVTRSPDVHLPPPPESFGPLVSLTPEYYTLDELRDVLRYLPDPLWVSLYRVSLLYMLDNDHDGRINSTDISFFMDWGIKTVGRDVLPDQLAEVLQTYAALHCWHRCLHVAECIESERAATAATAQPRPGHRRSAGAGSSMRTHRRPISSSGAIGGDTLSLHQRAQRRPNQSVSSFMLLHFREAFLNTPAGGPVPLPGAIGIAAMNADVDNMSPSQSSALFESPRSAISQPVTDSVRYAAATHFAEWMLRVVQNQERDRRHERQFFERRVRCMATTAEVKLGNTTRLRHPSYVAQQSLRIRLSTTFLPAEAASADVPGEGDDLVVSVSQSSISGRQTSMISGILNGSAAVVAASSDADKATPELGVVPLTSAPQLPTSLSFEGPTAASATRLPHSPGTPAALKAFVKTLPHTSSHSRSAMPLSVPVALGGGGSGSPEGTRSPRSPPPTTDAGILPPIGSGSPDSHRGTAAGGPLFTGTSPAHQPSRPRQSAVAPTTQSMPSGGPPSSGHLDAAETAADLPAGASANANGIGISGKGEVEDGSFSNDNACSSSSSLASAAAAGAAATTAAATTTPNSGSAAPLLEHQVSVLLMDAEAFYVQLEATGWCTIGAVEEVYLDFAVEESYCMPFWSFCRLLNQASADEVQAALELPTDQAVAVLTSAAAVEEYRQAAAVRQLQRHVPGQRDGGSGSNNRYCGSVHGSGWASHLQLIPMFVVSEYTFVVFVAAFIHAYWAMLESMGVDP
uniref:EF-hand domain-containing protein n=1 Tax=Leishmania guyanensis TaxID=5670 RepID=A0A1E1ISN9_LEIGU|nr:hypothetical protein, unknown function [Leishmania guyanensis]